MENKDTLFLSDEKLKPVINSGFDPLTILKILVRNWYWFFIFIILGLFFARFLLSHTLPVFNTSATILINETEDRPLVDNSELLQGLGLPGGMQNLENQMMIIKSRDLVEQTLEELPFDVDFYFKTFRNNLSIYPEMPLIITGESEAQLPKGIEFEISYIDSSTFGIRSMSKYHPLDLVAAFGNPIEFSRYRFRVDCRDSEWFESHRSQPLYFVLNNRASMVNHYSNRLKVELISRGGSILRVSKSGTNPTKDADFINKHIENFQDISLEKKNLEADRRIRFIDEQLTGISDSLSFTENRLQQFRSANRVMDVSAQGQSIIGQVAALEAERARLNLEANYYDYLAEYLNKDEAGELPIVPITMGITDPGLTRLVDELAALQGQLSTTGAGEMNPLQRNLEQRVRSTKSALKETLNGLRRANSLARSENQQQINRANAQASALPVTERQLLGIERTFKLNDELYTFLLETRAEQQMQKASNRANSELIDRADDRFSTVIAPSHTKVYFVCLFGSIALPGLIIFLSVLFGNSIKYEDVIRLPDASIVGQIPHESNKKNTIVLEDSGSSIAESFRLLRSRIQFLTRDSSNPVILVTSSMPGDGKTFNAINLASIYSLLGKRAVIVGFDLRKPKIFDEFNLKNDRGVSTWLIGKDSFENIIQQTQYDNLSVITAGPIPPNPSELIALKKTEELFKLLKARFDFIIIDTSPIGMVSDTYHLANLSDACLLVIRLNKTPRDVLTRTIRDMKTSGIKSISLVLNDISSKSNQYGYGEKYGYTGKRKRGPRTLLGLFNRV